MTVLYRKYRPRTFAEVAGQEHVKAALAHQAASGTPAHSYLFSGPRGVGKTSLARIFAKALNCPTRTKAGEPCGACETCQEIAEGRSLDVIEIDAASHTGVDNVREQIIEHARFAPSKSAYKVFIVDEVHMLSTSAFNALLKTLEEPPAKVVFVLATTELHKLPATVISRCQRYDFRKIPASEMSERLVDLAKREGFEVETSVIETVTRLSEGCLRDAESLLSQLFALGEKTITAASASLTLPMVPAEASAALLEELLAKDATAALARWEGLMDAGADPIRIVTDVAERCRERVLGLVRQGAQGADLSAAAELMERLVRALPEMKRIDPPELGFELLLVEWCSVRAEKPPERRDPPSPPKASVAAPSPAPEAKGEASPASERRESPPPTPVANASLEKIKDRWPDILAASQKRNHGLPYMLGAAELLDCAGGTLTVGFQYAMYRDRLNDKKHRDHFEAALEETLGERMTVKAILVAQRTDGLVEPSPHIRVEGAHLPDGFADLVKEFGGTVA